MWAEPVANEEASEFRDVTKLKRRLQWLDGEFKKFDYSPGNLSALLTSADAVFQEVGAVIVNHFKTHHQHHHHQGGGGLPPDSLHVYASWINLSGTINRLRALTHSDVAALTIALDNTAVVLENLKTAKRTVELSKFLTSEALTDSNNNDARGASIIQRYTREPLVSFDDIVGMDVEKQRIMSVTTLTKYGLNSNMYGAMLLYGPPGTGKSTFVEAAARQMDAQYVFITNSDLFLPSFGAAETLLADIFNAASAIASSRGKIVLLFFDEIDTISGRDANEIKASLTAVFLHHLDAKRLSRNVFVAAATNYMERVDPAIARRLMPAIKLPLPNADIIRVMLERMCVFLPDAMGWANAMCQLEFSQANVKTVVNGVMQALKMWSVSSGLFVETDGGYDLTTLGTSTLLKKGYARVWSSSSSYVDYRTTTAVTHSVWFTDVDIAQNVSSIVYVPNEQQIYDQFNSEMKQVMVVS